MKFKCEMVKTNRVQLRIDVNGTEQQAVPCAVEGYESQRCEVGLKEMTGVPYILLIGKSRLVQVGAVKHV